MSSMVKCPYCGMSFDREKEPYQKIGARRYAHITCHETAEASKTPEERDKEQLINYIKNLFGKRYDGRLVSSQLKKYMKDYNYSYKGMYKTLIYVYEIKQENISRARGVGLIPYYYEDARKYYSNLKQIFEKTENVNLKEYLGEATVIKMLPPTRKPRRKRIFTFLDEEGTDEE